MISRVFVFVVYAGLLVTALGGGAFAWTRYATATRGVEVAVPQGTPRQGGGTFAGKEEISRSESLFFGTNVALEQYASEAELQGAFDTLKRLNVNAVRQYFPWREIETERGTYRWDRWDPIVAAARQNKMSLVAVLTTAPAWSQRPGEVEMPNAPPNDFGEYARFVGEFARRYKDSVRFYQIWDEPNVKPNWGKRNADPVEYAQLLIPASEAIRANDEDAVILTAGLAMNLELHRPHPNYSEILYLRGLYEVGANKYWDVVAAKPYGMWTGPEDRTVNSGVLNFSRLILLRDEMLHYGEGNKPLWAVEMGWNALPSDWKGQPSPWGTDAGGIQAGRLTEGLRRTYGEWAWVTGMFPLYLQPKVAADDPRQGFALLGAGGQETALYEGLTTFSGRMRGLSAIPAAPIVPVMLLALVAVAAGWRAWHYLFLLRFDVLWGALKTRARALPEPVQWGGLAAIAAAFYWSPSVPLNFVLMGLLVVLFALRMDLGLALTVLVIPFWNFPKTLFGGFQLSPVEAFTWVATAGFVLDAVGMRGTGRHGGMGALKKKSWKLELGDWLGRLSTLDWAVLAFVILGLVSTQWAGNFGVASREFRIVVLDAGLLYGLIRATGWRGGGSAGASKVPGEGREILRQRTGKGVAEGIRAGAPLGMTGTFAEKIVGALLLSGVVVCAIGLYQYVTGDVIVADGVGRLTAVWGSPNNVGLYLGRLLPVALAFVFLLSDNRAQRTDARQGITDEGRRTNDERRTKAVRVVCAGLVGLFGVTILLTFSRGALFVGVPASVLFVMVGLWLRSHVLSRRAWVVIGIGMVAATLAIVPFLFSERMGSLGTAFTRVAVWTSAVNMIRDHPLLGVGLDNFLYEYPKYILPEAWAEPNLSHPHNFVLDFWVRLGLGGVLIFGWMVVAFYRGAWKLFMTTGDAFTRALMLGLMASVVDMLAHGLIDASFFVVDLAYVFMVTLALGQIEPIPPAPLPYKGRGEK